MKVLIDFENVNFPGLDGIKGLTKDDEFLIFYNDTARISFDLHRQIEKLDCKKEYQKIASENDNALDFLLSTILGRYIAIDSISSYAIISKAEGYDVIIKYWKAKGINIGRYSSIREAMGNKAPVETPVEGKSTEAVVEDLFTDKETFKETPKENTELDINNLINTRNPENN